MPHPGKELDQVSARISGGCDTAGKVVDINHGMITFRPDWRVAVYDGHSHRYCGAAKMAVPLCGFLEAV